MFYVKDRQTTNFEKALAWHRQGLLVLILGWVKLTHAGKEKVLGTNAGPPRSQFWSDRSTVNFLELLKYRPKWKITTQSVDALTTRENRRGPLWYKTSSEVGNKFEKAKQVLKEALPTIKKEDVSVLLKNKRKRGCRQKRGMLRLPYDETKLVALQVEFEKVGKLTELKVLYHGTKVQSVASILKEGLKSGNHGMLGTGIYFGKAAKARRYSDLLVFECKVLLGKCKELEKTEDIHAPCNAEYDSMHLSSGARHGVYGGYLNNDEWIIRRPEQVVVTGLIHRK